MSSKGLVPSALRHLRAHLLGVDALENSVLDTGEDGPVSVHTKDHVQMLIVLKFNGVDHVNVPLVSLDSLNKRLAENEVVNVTIVDRVRREGAGEPGLGDARVKDASTVRESGHVPIKELRAGWHRN